MKFGVFRYEKLPALISLIIILVSLGIESRGSHPEDKVSGLIFTTSSPKALEEFNSGIRYTDAGDLLSSYACFSRAIELDPYFAMAYAYRAYCTNSREKFIRDAQTALSEVHKVSPFEKSFIYLTESYISGDEDKRMELVMRLIGMDPDNARSWMLLGLIQQERNEISDARSTFEKARKLAPDWTGIYTTLGVSYINYYPVDLEKALHYFKKAAELNPEFTSLHLSLGDIYTALNENDLAAMEYNRAISATPENWISYIYNGYAKSCLGQFEKARQDYQIARRQALTSDIGYIMEALTYAYEGSPETCLQWLEQTTSSIEMLEINVSEKQALKYGFASARGWIALHYNKPDHFAKAKIIHNDLNTAITCEIENAELTLEMKVENLLWEGLEASLRGFHETAIVKACDMKMLIRKNKREDLLTNYHFLYGYVMYCQGRYGKAIEHLEQGDQNWVYNKFQLAKAYQANGEFDIATVLFQEVAAYNVHSTEFAIIRHEVKHILASK